MIRACFILQNFIALSSLIMARSSDTQELEAPLHIENLPHPAENVFNCYFLKHQSIKHRFQEMFSSILAHENIDDNDFAKIVQGEISRANITPNYSMNTEYLGVGRLICLIYNKIEDLMPNNPILTRNIKILREFLIYCRNMNIFGSDELIPFDDIVYDLINSLNSAIKDFKQDEKEILNGIINQIKTALDDIS